MKTKILVLAIALLLSVNLHAQVTIGALAAPTAGAILDLNRGTPGGLLLSNVDLPDLGVIPATGFTGITSPQDSKPELSGMIVYNTNTTTGIGIHVWDGDDWIKPCAPPAPGGPITFSSTSLLVGFKYTASVAPVAGATSYVWTLPSEFTVLGASDGATITFSPTTVATYSAALIVVRAKNACGESSRYTATQQIVVADSYCDPLPVTPLITAADVEFVNSDTSAVRNGIILSAPVRIKGIKGAKTDFNPSTSNSVADHRAHFDSRYGSWFTWCMVAQYADVLCPSPWRVPSREDFCMYANGSTTNTNSTGNIYGKPIANASEAIDGWLFSGGSARSGGAYGVGVYGHYWSSTPLGSEEGHLADVSTSFHPSYYNNRRSGSSLRCVKTAP
ncbi:MAG: fibrobacter succinogenes major paralogous domain-containing protein [Dysgonamonadaceae bacterium]|jgi:uncharacterized protein (TIGR02145 family)|nr:fibrobacter succinogenes major paralogous domain-containing protein [Dysgonamonadaceae bacterium]